MINIKNPNPLYKDSNPLYKDFNPLYKDFAGNGMIYKQTVVT
jgi:hypothetical protein